jgi:hypothetical protein
MKVLCQRDFDVNAIQITSRVGGFTSEILYSIKSFLFYKLYSCKVHQISSEKRFSFFSLEKFQISDMVFAQNEKDYLEHCLLTLFDFENKLFDHIMLFFPLYPLMCIIQYIILNPEDLKGGLSGKPHEIQ